MDAGRPPALARLAGRVRAAPYAALALAVLAAAAYLCLVNLDYAALWHDEAPTALIGRNLLERGDITGWDGRNLVGGTNGRTLNERLRDVLPPLMYAVNAASFGLFGVSESAARIGPALFGIASLALLYLLLRQHLANHPRLILFALALAAWSPQLLLYYRQSRYFAVMAFALIAAFYCYERWWRTGGIRWLAALTMAAALAFFNHYAGGAATMLALAAWHLLFRTRATAPRQWLGLAAGGAVVVALGAAYLVWIGLIGGERTGFLAYTGVTGVPEYRGTMPPILLRLGLYTRDLFAADWISWPVFLWFAGTSAYLVAARRRRARPSPKRQGGAPRRARTAPQTRASRAPREHRGDDLPLAAAGRVALMGALFALFSAALSPQPVWALIDPFTDLRYYMGALPLLLVMKALFVEWAWRRWRVAGAAALAVLLCSSAGAWPINMRNVFTGERTLGLHLLQFVREIHRPYRDSIRVASDYLLEHAEQDEVVFVPGFNDREALIFATGHRLLFCCVLDEESPLPAAAVASLGDRLAVGGTVPDWIVLFGTLSDSYWDRVKGRYALAAQLDVHPYPTQRPEINLHAFAPLPAHDFGVHVLRRTATDELAEAAEALARDGRYEEALGAWRRILELDAEHAAAQAGLGRTLFALQRHEEAVQALGRALALQPDRPDAGSLHRLMGHAAHALQRPEEAAGHYERALRIDADDPEAIDRLALVRFEQRRFEDALGLYRRLLALLPDNALAHVNLGVTLYRLGRHDEAIGSLERALSLDPDLETARTTLESIRASVRQEAP